jgi:2-polyprenyl-6-methoxyphenol hydroxylase-like FAD-dependent oxidoreductase
LKRDTAVILGGGFAGMLSASMLARHFKQVIIEEKFSYVSAGIAQAPHLHVLLKQGQNILEHYFPGILDEMRRLSCKEVDWAADTVWHSPFGMYPRFHSGIVTVNCSRLLLDRLMYQWLQAIPNIKFKYGMNDKSSSVDLFVDARGRNAEIAILKNARTTIVTNNLAYATQFYQLPDNHSAPFKQIYVPVYIGINDRGCVISPIEENKVVVTLIGRGNARPSKSQEGFLQHLVQLNNQAIIEYMRKATPVSDIKLFTDLSNEHRHLSKIKHWPRNVVVLGDAVCKINPIYGQGMMLASKQVALLEKHLVNNANVNTRLIQKKIDKVIAFSWLMATTSRSKITAIFLSESESNFCT